MSDPTRAAVHYRLKSTRGLASEHVCECGRQAMDWAFDEPAGFSGDLSRYRPLCRSCHTKADMTPERRAALSNSAKERHAIRREYGPRILNKAHQERME